MCQAKTRNAFSAKTKSKLDLATGKKTSLLILLEADGFWIQIISNPVLAHLWSVYMGVVLHTHPVHGEPHIQHNTNPEVAKLAARLS